MTKQEKATLTCPKCGAETDFEIYSSVNAQISPHLAESLMDGSLFSLACPNCETPTSVFYPCLFHDMDARVMVQLLTEDEVDSFVETMDGLEQDELVRACAESYEKRMVFSQSELREKALILRDGYDDGLMEIFKLFVKMMGMRQSSIDGSAKLLYDRTDGDTIDIAVFEEGKDGPFFVSAAKAMYDDLGKRFGFEAGRGGGYLVDEQWALRATQRAEE